MSKKYDKYEKRKWIQWCGRILKEDSKKLLNLSSLLVAKGKLQTINRNTVIRFALLSLLKTLENIQINEEKKRVVLSKDEQLLQIQRETENFMSRQKEKLLRLGVTVDV